MSDLNSLSIDQGNDGSLEMAAQLMPDFESDTPENEEKQPSWANQKRAEDGRFDKDKAKEAKPSPEADDTNAEAEEEEVEAATTDDEWFELPPEREGEAPRRIKAEEVWQGYQEREELREKIDQMQRTLPPPPQYDEEIYRTVQVRHHMMNELRTLMAVNQPIEPDMSLINQASNNYDPGEYHRQVTLQRDMVQRHNQLRERLDAEKQHVEQEQEVLTTARKAREQGKLVQFWPELRDPVVQRQVRDDAARYFGIDDGVFSSVIDARFYAVLRHALNDINGHKQRQQAVKVVRAKPKLVRGAARGSTNQKQQQFGSSMKRLQSSNSVEDAAEAFGALNF
jgi:hypothetical protein